MPIGPNNLYPSLEDIASLVRVYINDSKQGATGTPGEGQILTDMSFELPVLMNSAIRVIYRAMRIMGNPMLIKDNYILFNLPPVNSILGVGVMNPAIQVALNYVGYFDGLGFNADFLLPADLLMPLELWERQSGTSNPFGLMTQSTGALSPRNQVQSIGDWEYRTDGIWMNGATEERDVRIRYIATYQNIALTGIDWSNTFVPILDSQEAIAWTIALPYCGRLGGDNLQYAMQMKKESILQLRQQITRSRQMIDYQRPVYGQGIAGSAGDPSRYLY